MSKSYTLKCFLCKKDHTEQESVTSCLACGGPLETYHDYEKIHQKLNRYALMHAPISAMKYVAFYPIDDFQNIVSLEEGGTPLIHAEILGKKLGLEKLYIKNEGLNPTGCFKDRGTMVEITKAKEMGAKGICLASTGNMAASCAAYSTALGIPCYILVPEGTPIGKISQTLTFGARVIQIRGSYSQCAVLAERMAKRFNFYLAGDYTFRTEGQKSQGYEIIEQLFWKAPDYVVCPIGCGTNFHAIYKGMKEFYDLGIISTMPKLIGVQAEGACTVVKSFEAGKDDFDTSGTVNTVASAMAVNNPLDGAKILFDIRESKGIAVAVSDEEILESQQEQARLAGIFAEPSGSSALAAVKKLNKQGFFKKDDTIVCIATGNGLKDPKAPLKILPEPASVEPIFEEIEKFIELKLYALKESGTKEQEKMLFTSLPTKEELAKTIEKKCGIHPTPEIIESSFTIVESFITRGKHIRKSDLEYIIEEVLASLDITSQVLCIEDFVVETGLKKKAKAHVVFTAFESKEVSEAEKSGPVDAVISAIIEGVKKKDILEIKLVDYEVQINTKSVEATVEVKMTLTDKTGNKIVSKASSPDVIVASIKAFERGFNLLYQKKSLS